MVVLLLLRTLNTSVAFKLLVDYFARSKSDTTMQILGSIIVF